MVDIEYNFCTVLVKILVEDYLTTQTYCRGVVIINTYISDFHKPELLTQYQYLPESRRSVKILVLTSNISGRPIAL